MKQLKRYKSDQEYSAIGIRNGKYALIKQEFMQGCFKKEIYIYNFSNLCELYIYYVYKETSKFKSRLLLGR